MLLIEGISCRIDEALSHAQEIKSAFEDTNDVRIKYIVRLSELDILKRIFFGSLLNDEFVGTLVDQD